MLYFKQTSLKGFSGELVGSLDGPGTPSRFQSIASHTPSGAERVPRSALGGRPCQTGKAAFSAPLSPGHFNFPFIFHLREQRCPGRLEGGGLISQEVSSVPRSPYLHHEDLTSPSNKMLMDVIPDNEQ
uniref:Uncharacterized protein n=1 Tax=Myotis myotis TaxID=51298 RepID=A0A7J7ZX68_MYOMY|nr:hypothetical protein mMyoMyo1_009637 [Myotis myotis]